MKITFEGTPEEIAKTFPGVMAAISVTEDSLRARADTDAEAFVSASADTSTSASPSAELAYRTLTRLPLAPEQTLVLRELYAAHPERTSTADLAAKVSYSKAQFTGLMGAFGRRFVNTQGHVAGMSFFDKKWVDGSYAYTLPETVREAMRRAKLV